MTAGARAAVRNRRKAHREADGALILAPRDLSLTRQQIPSALPVSYLDVQIKDNEFIKIFVKVLIIMRT